jgi:inositol 1,4,5-triphosphate receptor type 3
MSEQFDISGDDGSVSRRCPNIIACFIRHFDFGQRAGAGISDDLSKIGFDDPLFYGRFFYDMVFFIIVKLLLLNMINGIIVQTFSDLRESDDMKQEDRKGQCFICSIEKKEFEKQNVDFDNHVRITHSVTQYVNYIIQLKLASPYDLTFNESVILEAFKNRKVDIFPIYKTSDLPEYNHEEIEEEDEDD